MEKSPYRQRFGGDKSPSPTIIVDRKKKQFYYGFDQTWKDPMGVESAKEAKKHEIPIDPTSLNPIHRFLTLHTPKDLLGRKLWCMKSDQSKTYEGRVVDIIPPSLLKVKVNGNNLVMEFESCIALGDL